MPKTAEDYAREAAEPYDAARSTDDKPRPVSVTSLDEAKAATELTPFEVEHEHANGRRQVVRVLAEDLDDALERAGLDPDCVIDVREVLPAGGA